MWDVVGKTKDTGLFGRFEPIDLLIWHDGPRTFTLHDADGGLCLAHWLDEDADFWRYAVVPISQADLDRMTRGEMTIIEGLDQPRVFAVDQNVQGEVIAVWLTALSDLPRDTLPKPGTMLRRELEPFFSLKATGRTIVAGAIPSSVIKTTVENAQKAIKCLAEYEMEIFKRRGHPSRSLKMLYDLPAQKLLAASFEVQFRSPLMQPSLFDGLPAETIKEEKDVLSRVGENLRIGMEWLKSESANSDRGPSSVDDVDLRDAIVEAMKYLTPPSRGAIEAMEVRGEILGQTTPQRLTREHRRRVSCAEKQSRPRHGMKKFDKTVTIIDILGEDLMIRVEWPNEQGETISRQCQMHDDIWELYGESFHVNQSIQLFGTETEPKKPIQIYSVQIIETKN